MPTKRKQFNYYTDGKIVKGKVKIDPDGYLFHSNAKTKMKLQDLPKEYVKVYYYLDNYIRTSDVIQIYFIPNIIGDNTFKYDKLIIQYKNGEESWTLHECDLVSVLCGILDNSPDSICREAIESVLTKAKFIDRIKSEFSIHSQNNSTYATVLKVFNEHNYDKHL